MATIKIDGFIHFRQNRHLGADYMFSIGKDMTEYGYTCIGPHTINFEVPADFNPVAAEVEALEKQKAKLRDDFNLSIARINDRISKITAIEYTPAGAAA